MARSRNNRRLALPAAVLAAAVFGAAGLLWAGLSGAASFGTSQEAEAGQTGGNAAAVALTGASGQGSNAIRFGTSGGPLPAGVWNSGATTEDPDGFAAWRGRPLDNNGTWPNRERWEIIKNPDIYGAVSALSKYRTISIGAAMLPEQEAASFANCARGDYDQYWREYGANIARLGRNNPDTYIRLGWEANGSWYAWSIRNDIANYKACFRREVQAIRSAAPDVRIDWNMNKDSHMDQSVALAYPGDDVVDVVGVDFYDNWPAYQDKAAWDADYMSTQNGGPRGMGSWLKFAKDRGKKLSVPEWGLSNGSGNQNSGGGTDNPYFMQAMYGFFAANSRDIAYETYFNLQDDDFIIWPAGINPQGSAEYRRLWSASPRP